MTCEELMVGVLVDHEGGRFQAHSRVHVCLLNFLMGSISGPSTGKGKESKHFARILVQAFYLWYLVHCRDRSETFNIPSEDEHRVGSRKSSECRRAV